jgi:hypothetical protein
MKEEIVEPRRLTLRERCVIVIGCVILLGGVSALSGSLAFTLMGAGWGLFAGLASTTEHGTFLKSARIR